MTTPQSHYYARLSSGVLRLGRLIAGAVENGQDTRGLVRQLRALRGQMGRFEK